MTRVAPSHPLPAGHVILPAATIGGLSTLLAIGLGVLHILDRIKAAATGMVLQGKEAVFFKEVPGWCVWLATVVMAFSLALAILSVPGTWRRLILWITALVLVAGWAPVLVLASRPPDIGGPLVAVFWSGLCAMVYTRNHRMGADEIANGGAP